MTHARTITFDEWTLHRATGEIEKHGKRSRLPDQAHLILEELLASSGQLVTREHLIARLWPQGVVDFEGSLNAAVRKLRSILGDDAETPRFIETVPRKGYRFVGTISESNQRTALTEVEHAALTAPQPRSGRRVYKRSWLLAAITTILVVLAFFLYSSSVETPRLPVRLAVMPFENLSPDAADAFFTDGIHEEILSTLAHRAANLSVISRTTMMTYRATPKSVTDIAKELGVTHVLEGSVRREGQMVRVSLKLIDARKDRPVWTKHYDRQLVSAIALQSEVATEVTSRLSVELLANAKPTPVTTSPEAYDLYLKGKLASRSVRLTATAEEFARIEALFNRAIELDPLFAAAYVERAFVRQQVRSISHDLTDAHVERIRNDIATARHLGGETPTLLWVESRFVMSVSGNARALESIEAAESLGAQSAQGLKIKARK